MYTLKVPTTQPHLWVLGTSVGLLLLSIGTNQVRKLSYCGLFGVMADVSVVLFVEFILPGPTLS